jgi:phage terminase small subunit
MTKKTLPSNLRIIRAPEKTLDVVEKIHSRIPKADWLDNPDLWDASKFIKETADFMYETYGIDADQDKHLLAMLADQISIYVEAKIGMTNNGLITEYNAGITKGASIYFGIMQESLKRIVILMNELGLTPRGRLNKVVTPKHNYNDLLGGVKVTQK